MNSFIVSRGKLERNREEKLRGKKLRNSRRYRVIGFANAKRSGAEFRTFGEDITSPGFRSKVMSEDTIEQLTSVTTGRDGLAVSHYGDLKRRTITCRSISK